MKIILKISILLMILMSVSGCSAFRMAIGADPHQKTVALHKTEFVADKAKSYVYFVQPKDRGKFYVDTTKVIYQKVGSEYKEVAALDYYKSIYPVEVPTGENRFYITSCRTAGISIDAEPGKIYYVKLKGTKKISIWDYCRSQAIMVSVKQPSENLPFVINDSYKNNTADSISTSITDDFQEYDLEYDELDVRLRTKDKYHTDI